MALAKTAPELIPALLWLIAQGGRSKMAKACRTMRPSVEELAALMVYIGEPVREILSHNKALLESVERVDVAQWDLLSIRRKALKRLGLGVESLF